MITLYLKSLNKVITDPDHSIFEELKFEDLLWIDLLDPTPRERIIVENYLDFTIQTREQAEEIETSSRYSEHEGYIQCNSNFSILKEEGFIIEPVSFTIIHDILISMRTCYLRTFAEASRKLQISYKSHTTGYHILVSLLEARIDLDADMVEVISKQIAAISNSTSMEDKGVDKEVLLKINRLQESTMLLRETIFDRQRLLSGAQRSDMFPDEIYTRITIMLKDIGSLLNHADFNFERLEFLQDMYMGLINIEQNKIIKMFTVLSVIFMPPTLIASMYGMNFEFMPELDWDYGYLFAIGMMLASMGATLLFFKRKNWL
ncbi:MAG: magnesium/cobalt transporter CorA [Rikenellaceae bacterium]